jgi:hypothetical protein
MKTLIALSALQTIVIAALAVHAFREPPRLAADVRPANPIASTGSAAAPSSDEDRLRAIIREELGQLHVERDAPPQVAPRPRDRSADLQQRANVEQQIETYRGSGAITEAQMQDLQADIAQLDDAARKQMMSKLIRALNSGDIKGRL